MSKLANPKTSMCDSTCVLCIELEQVDIDRGYMEVPSGFKEPYRLKLFRPQVRDVIHLPQLGEGE